MTLALLRADGSVSLGMGHVMRCLAVAEGLKKMKINPMFLIRSMDEAVEHFIRSRGHEVEIMPADISMKAEAGHVRVVAERRHARLIVTDIVHAGTRGKAGDLILYHQALASPETFLIVLADADTLDIPGDVLVSPYVQSSPPDRPTAPNRRLLLGPSYFIFRPEFISAAELPHPIPPRGHRIFVGVGGSDMSHITSRILQALGLLGDLRLNLRVVQGPRYTDALRLEIRDILHGHEGEYTLLEADANLAEEMIHSDLAVVGEGLIKYEAAITGTPAIVLSHAHSDPRINAEFAAAGSAVYAGDGTRVEVSNLAHLIRSVLEDAPLRRSMSLRGKAMVDGHGLDRILSQLPVGVTA